MSLLKDLQNRLTKYTNRGDKMMRRTVTGFWRGICEPCPWLVMSVGTGSSVCLYTHTHTSWRCMSGSITPHRKWGEKCRQGMNSAMRMAQACMVWTGKKIYIWENGAMSACCIKKNHRKQLCLPHFILGFCRRKTTMLLSTVQGLDPKHRNNWAADYHYINISKQIRLPPWRFL